LSDVIDKSEKVKCDTSNLQQTVEFIENPEPTIIQIAESENGEQKLEYVQGLLTNDLTIVEQNMNYVSEEMAEQYQIIVNETESENKNILLKLNQVNINSFTTKAITDINDSDVTYSKVMAGIATASALTMWIGVFLKNASLISIGTTAFISSVLTFCGIFVIKPELGMWVCTYFLDAIKSGCLKSYEELHKYMLLNFCPNETTLLRYEQLICVWAMPLSVFFFKEIFSWLSDWFKGKFPPKSAFSQSLSKNDYYNVIKYSKKPKNNNNPTIDKKIILNTIGYSY